MKTNAINENNKKEIKLSLERIERGRGAKEKNKKASLDKTEKGKGAKRKIENLV